MAIQNIIRDCVRIITNEPPETIISLDLSIIPEEEQQLAKERDSDTITLIDIQTK